MTLDQLAEWLDECANEHLRSGIGAKFAVAAAACRELENSRELLTTRGASRLIDVAQNIPTFETYGRSRVQTDRMLREIEQ